MKNLKFLLIFAIAISGNVSNAQDNFKHLSEFVKRAYSKTYIPSPRDKFDPIAALPLYLGHAVQDSHFYLHDLEGFGANPEELVDQEISGLVSAILRTDSGKEIRKALAESRIQNIKFYFHVVHLKNANIESWTDTNFNIHIFLQSPNIRKVDLIKMITHELAQLTSKVDLDALRAVTNSIYSDIDQMKSLIAELSESKRFTVAITTFRAFQMEARVLAQLGANGPNTHVSALSCIDLLKLVSLSISAMHYNFEASQIQYSGYVDRDAEAFKLEKFVHLLSKNKKSAALCRELSKPEFTNTPQVRSGWGPRPNTGGADGGFRVPDTDPKKKFDLILEN